MSALDTYRDLRSLREWIESHGFTARIVHGKIEIEIRGHDRDVSRA